MIYCKVTMAMAVMLLGLYASMMSVYAKKHTINSGVQATVSGTRADAGAGASPTVFDVRQFDPIGDGVDDSDDYGLESENSISFRSTWMAACRSPGEVKLVIPPGKFMIGRALFSGPCKATHITFEIHATLVANPDPSYYNEPSWFNFERINSITLTGSGIFDATTGPMHQTPCRSDDPGCATGISTIRFTNVTNGVIEGLQSINAMGFHVFLSHTGNVAVRNMRITSPPNALNSDGIHVEQSNVVSLLNNVIGTGEDCVSIGNRSRNITVSGITCGPGNGISVGNLAKLKLDVQNVVVEKCKFIGTQYGVRIKHWPEIPGSIIRGITFQDLSMENVQNPITIDHLPQENSPIGPQGHGEGKISGVHFKNIRGTSMTDKFVNFECSPHMPCDAIEVGDIKLTYAAKKAAPLIHGIPTATCLNAQVLFDGVHDGIAC